jgi:hypothetical protein
VAQAVSRRLLTAEARVRVLVSQCGICGGQSGTRTGISPVSSVFPVSIIPPGFNTHITWIINNRPVGGRSSETSSDPTSIQEIGSTLLKGKG